MTSSVPPSRRSASWDRCRRAESVSLAQVPSPSTEIPLRSRRNPYVAVNARDSILLHSTLSMRSSANISNSLHVYCNSNIVADVRFLSIATRRDTRIMGHQRCKGWAVKSDGCAWTLWSKEGAYARS